MAAFENMELLRLLSRVCGHDISLQQKVVAACNGNIPTDIEVETILSSLKQLLEEMEEINLSIEELIERIKTAKPINAFDIGDLFTYK